MKFEDGSFFRFPNTRRSFSNLREILPVRVVPRGGPIYDLPRTENADIDALQFIPMNTTAPMTWAQSLEANYTDGIVVLHQGCIIYERYPGALTAAGQHIALSVTKSFVATIAASLISEGALDENAAVVKYVPELAGSGLADATIRQLLDMTTGLRFTEVYAEEESPFWQFCKANGFLPRPPGYTGPETSHAYLRSLEKEYPHGTKFVYRTVNTDALAWVIAKVMGRSISEVLRDRFWSRLGVEQDAFFTVDSCGIEFAGAGFNLALRDLARFGEMIRLGGYYNGQQIVPTNVIEDIRRGGDREKFAEAGYKTLPGWSYRNMWWVSHNDHGAFTARGIHGQTIYIDPKAEMVIARFASHPLAANFNLDPTSLPAYQALANRLI
ncbi:MAG TPA: serine hydrolase [Bryobacteraceae bacterium]|nr:serine hydrolase [Bryobacteraceae bacterium]